jgi:hypothetical protein
LAVIARRYAQMSSKAVLRVEGYCKKTKNKTTNLEMIFGDW